MGQRQAPTAEHPAPAPDWILGSDGHWKPPPFTGEGLGNTKRRAAAAAAAAEADATDEPGRPSVGGGVVFAVILVVIALSYLAWICLQATA